MSRAPSAADSDLVHVDEHGVVHPVGCGARQALQHHENRTLRLLPAPQHVVVMRAETNELGERQLWMSGEITSSGRLLDIVGMVAHARWRGELVLDDKAQQRSIFLQSGHVIGATSSATHERLGAMLRRFGEITDEQLQRALAEVSADVRFGDAAVRLGFIGQETLFRYLRRQTEEIVYSALTVTRGSFSFYEHIHEVPLPFPLRLSVMDILFEGVRRLDAIQGYRDRIPSNDHVPVRVEGCIVDAADEAYAVYLAVNGQRSVDDVAGVSGKGLFDTIRLLHKLDAQQAINVRPPRRSPLEGVVSDFNEAIRLIVAEADKYGTAGQDIRRSLELFAASSEAHAALFEGAGPAADGSLDEAKVVANVSAMNVADGGRALAGWLYEYATYAMFVAEPVMRAGAGREAASISSRVARLIAPLAPDF